MTTTLKDRDKQWLTEIGKLATDIANDVGGSQSIQAAVVQSVMLIMAGQDAERRPTYQFKDIEQEPGGTKLGKRAI